ncbi:hypothetical protein FOCC_FOCC008475 [Frankliniella occidentalis]|nr:hypothetical protein FOCC_FOCC008475 [Frankliniella occidentalis]
MDLKLHVCRRGGYSRRGLDSRRLNLKIASIHPLPLPPLISPAHSFSKSFAEAVCSPGCNSNWQWSLLSGS